MQPLLKLNILSLCFLLVAIEILLLMDKERLEAKKTASLRELAEQSLNDFLNKEAA